MAPVDVYFLGLAVLAFIVWIVNVGNHLIALVYGKWKLHRQLYPNPDQELPGVTVLKPLTGIDPYLYHNLESFFKMKYPRYELLFCVQDDIDPVIMVVQSLLAKYPEQDARLFIGGKTVGVNPKINNIFPGYERAKYDRVLISDSGLRMKEDTLMDMVLTMSQDEKVGLVHQMPFVCPRDGFPGVVESVYFATNFARLYLSVNFIDQNCTTGMSCLFLKKVLDECGGLKFLGQYLAEDFFLAHVFHKRGYRLKVASQPAWQNCGTYSIPVWHARMIRWGKLRTATLPHLIFVEPLFVCFVSALMGAFAFYYFLHVSPIVYILVHTLCWFLSDYTLCRIVHGGSPPFSRVDFLTAWLFTELACIYTLFAVHFTTDVRWRHRLFHVKWGGQLVEIERNDKI